MSKKQQRPPPKPLQRAPDTSLEARRKELDELIYSCAETVSLQHANQRGSEEHQTKAYLLKSMVWTHKSMVELLRRYDEKLYAGDVPVLARMQVERLYIALSLADNPAKWTPVFRKGAFKVQATRFLREKSMLGHFPQCAEDYGDTRWAKLVGFGKSLGASDDEIATLESEICGSILPSHFKHSPISNLPPPGQLTNPDSGALNDRSLTELARLFYPAWDHLCHYSHGGWGGIMLACTIAGEPVPHPSKEKLENLIQYEVIFPAHSMSYVAIHTASTLFAAEYRADSDLVKKLAATWSPYLCDGIPIGIAIWDTWAKSALGIQD